MRWCRRNPVVASLVAAVMLAILSGAGLASVYAVRAEHERARGRPGRGRRTSPAPRPRPPRSSPTKRGRPPSDSAEEARKRLVRLYVLTGGRCRDTGDTAAALLWFHRAWERDHDDPAADAAHRTRIAGAIDELPGMLRTASTTRR